MAVSSYGTATKTSGVVRIVKDLDVDLRDRHVLVVEDIVDSGLTLNYLRRYLGARSPASLEVCALLLKEGEQRVEQSLKYVGFTIPSKLRRRLRPRRRRAVPEPPGGLHLRGPRGERLMAVDVARVRAAVAELLDAIGEDVTRDGLLETPRRVADMYEELFFGDRRRPRTAPAGDVRGGPRRDGDGPRHPVHLALRAPPRPVHGACARRLHPRSGRSHHGAVEARTARRGLRTSAPGPRAHDRPDRRRDRRGAASRAAPSWSSRPSTCACRCAGCASRGPPPSPRRSEARSAATPPPAPRRSSSCTRGARCQLGARR